MFGLRQFKGITRVRRSGKRHASKSGHPLGEKAWENWWKKSDGRDNTRHIYFMGKDNIPFHTIIWPAILMGLNASNKGEISHFSLPGDLILEDNVSANEYLLLQGGQFSKSRKHAVWLPSYLERYDADALRYYLSINMPETHDADFRWEEYVDRVNNELIGTYGNFVHRVMTLTHRIDSKEGNPLQDFDNPSNHTHIITQINKHIDSAILSMEKQRFKEALRSIMGSPR